ncbi:hypothetical protein [Flavobacterium sp. CLA17]|uniref:hypothetical protein n=1 Tax=Flavobacterium sp. CLA17 TaxID=2724135 RepID=UPI001490AAB1|nr:hypothetical protein [Flavobacterium sp. CLA17]QSB25339.1 hypothetical protein HAV12_013240 [Flavobacterium sp. CLA17]
MEFKGEINLRILPIEISKLTILSKGAGTDYVCHKYFYTDFKVCKHIDFLNRKVSYHFYNENNERTELRTFSFDENPEESTETGCKKFDYNNGKLIAEIYFRNEGKKDILKYEGKFTYDEKGIVREDYYYPNEIYSIFYKFRSRNKIVTKVFPDSDENFEYYFDENDFLKKTINFKTESYCQINEYEYQDGRLHRLITYPNLKYKKNFFSKEIKLLQNPMFIHESKFFYDKDGLLIKEIKTDLIDNYEVEVLHYQYEK